ncbi:putative oxidoreductase [Xylaria bambusicola]|uniref:putative oxidoreductase n=1 Tax=Xylaria bambusicola TaxID=326684 RepID=UPI0020078997|nr:putative oxidoreductase [Xylaria bambusicola]KAI0521214.1 putative oxidoreductase [Xylaria bambusicola]
MPQLLFGTASFGMPMTKFEDVESVKELLKTLRDLGINRLDSGARYPPPKPGRAEELIGEASDLSKDFIVDTKVYTDTKTDGSGDLTVEAIASSTSQSLQRLKRPEGVNILHIHRADPSTPLEEQLRGFHEQISQGHCKKWGVSNVPIPTLEKMLQLCEQNGWEKPSCYQGPYNLVTRGMEKELLPLLRAHGIAFNAFQSLAAGFLTGKLVNDQHAGTRFGDDHPLGAIARKMFGGEDLLAAMKKFDKDVKALGLTPLEVAARWITHHSALGDDDGVLLGASKSDQIVDTVGIIRKGPLPDAVLPFVDELWDAVKETRGAIL